MGLAGGEHGPKAALREAYPGAWAGAQSLEQINALTFSSPAETLAVIDGNVLAMGVPSEITTLRGMADFLARQVTKHFNAANNVVVVLDNPSTLTKAKRAEQMRRDASRKKSVPTSEDLAPTVTDDNFLTRDLPDEEDVRVLIGNRKTRMRILDAVFLSIFKTIERKLLGRLPGAPVASFSVCGCDFRGGNRPNGEARRHDVLSTDDDFGEALEAVKAGEGDLQLTEVVDIAIANRRGVLADFKTVHVFTIDTDSILIELAADARRIEENALVNTFVVFKERGPKRDSADRDKPRFNLLDVTVLLEHVAADIFGMKFKQIAPSLVRPGIVLFLMCQAAQGTDFCCLKGLRTREVTDALRVVCSEELHYLSVIPSVYKGTEEDVLLAEPSLRRVLSLCGCTVETLSRRRAHASSLKSPMQADVLKVLWTGRYWTGQEMLDVHKWGFSQGETVESSARASSPESVS